MSCLKHRNTEKDRRAYWDMNGCHTGQDDRRACPQTTFRWLAPDVNKIKVDFDEGVNNMVVACAFAI